MSANAASQTTALIMLGANHNALSNLKTAVARLRLYCDVTAISSVYESAATGDSAGDPPYLNAAAQIVSDMLPTTFKLLGLRTIEAQLGRRRDGSTPPGEVPVDLDIALWGDMPITYGSKPWRSPAPDIVQYAFVALPLAEIAPEVIHPDTGERLAEIALRFADAPIQNLGRLLG